MVTAVTDANGVAVFPLPARSFTRYDGSVATAVAPLSAGGFVCQVTAEPRVGGAVSVASTVTVQAITLTLKPTAIATAPAGITIRLLAWGL